VSAEVSPSPISRQAAHQGLVETSALTSPPKISPTSDAPGKPLALRLPASHQATTPRLTRSSEVRTARPRVPTRLGSFRCASLWANRLCRAQTPIAPQPTCQR
jgi:hypothetical protein